MNFDPHFERSLGGIFFVKQKTFLKSEELPFSQLWHSYMLGLAVDIFNTQSQIGRSIPLIVCYVPDHLETLSFILQ